MSEEIRYGIKESDLIKIIECLDNIHRPVQSYDPELNEVVFLKSIIKKQMDNADETLKIIKSYFNK